MVDDILKADPTLSAFLTAVHAQTVAAGASQASMYDVGDSLGMSRAESQRAAESLIGMELLEVRTLSGGIGLSADGLAACTRMTGGGSDGNAPAASLSSGPIMSEADREVTVRMLDKLKFMAGDRSWIFDALTDLLADLKTIDAQLNSSRPKTAIIKECLASVKALLVTAGHADVADEVGRLLG